MVNWCQVHVLLSVLQLLRGSLAIVKLDIYGVILVAKRIMVVFTCVGQVLASPLRNDVVLTVILGLFEAVAADVHCILVFRYLVSIGIRLAVHGHASVIVRVLLL